MNHAEDWQIYDDAGRRKYLTAGELARFLASADRYPPPMQAFCHVLADTGCRISEALALTSHQLDRECMRLTFKTLKRRRRVFRTVPIPATTVHLLCSLSPIGDGHFWSMHRTTAWRGVKVAMMRAGLVGPMACPKGLRHGFGIRAAGRDVPANLIQRWMGHASPVTTAIYLDAVGAEERQFASRMW